jgi:protein required for attachment to host cells
MPTTWIIAADASRARILQVADPEQLVEIEDFLNPDGRLSERELVTDAEPRLHGSTGQHSAREATSAVEHSVELFAKRIGNYLDKARNDHRYDRLLLVAPPRLLGQIRKELGKEVEKLVVDEIDKDLSWFNAREIERYFAKGSGRAP